MTLWANDKQIGEGRLDKTVPVAFTSYAGMDIGRDNGLVVDLAYEDKAPYAVHRHGEEGRLRPQAGHHEDETALHEHASIHAVAHGVGA